MRKLLIMMVVALIAGCAMPVEAQARKSSTKKTATTKRTTRKSPAKKKAAKPFKGEFTYSDDKYDYILYMDLYNSAESGYFTVSDKVDGGYMGMMISEVFQIDSPEPFIILSGGLIPDGEDAVAARVFVIQEADGSITLFDENSYVFKMPATFKRVGDLNWN